MEGKGCRAPGCRALAGRNLPYCREHVHRLRTCAFEGCTTKIAAYNRSGYCPGHKWYAQKLKRASRVADDT